MNEGLFGISYGGVFEALRRRVRYGQGTARVLFDALVLRTRDTATPASKSLGGSTVGANVADMVIELPYAVGRKGAAITAAGALSLQVPDGGLTGGNRRGNGAVDLQTSRTAATQVASGPSSFAACTGSTASGVASIAMGLGAVASGNYAVALGNATANSIHAVAIGETCIAGQRAIAAGNNATASGSNSTAIGFGALANASESQAYGRATARGISNAIQWSTTARASAGDRQIRWLPHVAVTTNATTTTLTTHGGAEATSNTWVLPNNYSGIFSGWVLARNTTNNDSKGWRIEGMVSRDASAATIALLGAATITAVGTADASMASVTLAVTVNTTNGALIVQGTGIAATTIAWTGWLEAGENG